MNNNIAGKVVVIKGASSGLGAATAQLLATQGASVVLGARCTDCIFAMSQPEEVDINEILFRPTRQDL